jgi:hypothetical protein
MWRRRRRWRRPAGVITAGALTAGRASGERKGLGYPRPRVRVGLVYVRPGVRVGPHTCTPVPMCIYDIIVYVRISGPISLTNLLVCVRLTTKLTRSNPTN